MLEDVLRRYEIKTIALVAARIRLKIGWQAAPHESDGDFLAAYYAAPARSAGVARCCWASAARTSTTRTKRRPRRKLWP